MAVLCAAADSRVTGKKEKNKEKQFTSKAQGLLTYLMMCLTRLLQDFVANCNNVAG